MYQNWNENNNNKKWHTNGSKAFECIDKYWTSLHKHFWIWFIQIHIEITSSFRIIIHYLQLIKHLLRVSSTKFEKSHQHKYCQQSIIIIHIILIYLNLNVIFVRLHEFVYTKLHCLALYMWTHTFNVSLGN